MNPTVEKIVNKKTAMGSGIGAIFGFFFAGPLGSAAGAVIGGAIANIKPLNKGEMTPKRKIAFETAMASTDPNYIRGVADAFAGEGFTPHAAMLKKRADLRSVPPQVHEARKQAFREMMASDQPDQIESTAAAFAGETQTHAASALRMHADAVRAAHAAGKSATPLPDDKMLEGFADKLAKALLHFGPHNPHTKTAAANFVRARGIQPTEETVMETIAACAAELEVDMTPPVPSAMAEEGPGVPATPEGPASPDSSGSVPVAPSTPAAPESGPVVAGTTPDVPASAGE